MAMTRMWLGNARCRGNCQMQVAIFTVYTWDTWLEAVTQQTSGIFTISLSIWKQDLKWCLGILRDGNSKFKKKEVTITKLSNAIAMIATVIGWYKKGTQLFTRKRRAQPSNYSWSSIAVLVSVSIYFFILFYVPFEISPSPLCCQSNCVVRIKATNN